MTELRRLAAALEPPAGTRVERLQKAGAHAERFLESLPGREVYSVAGSHDEALSAFAISEDPGSFDEALRTLDKYVDGTGHNLGSSRFFAYIPSGGLHESALADYLAAISNRYAGVGAAAPGATRMEASMLRWLADVVGYPSSAEGDLTSGGSMATLSAIVAAREAFGLRSADIPSSVVYLTAQTHHTFKKALHVAGLAECVVHEIALDDACHMDDIALRAQIKRDQHAGLRPWLIAASAGTTDTGAVDPLDRIADIAKESAVWMHVDAAYGGAFALCDEGRQRLQGIERSDSLILDPHKGFFLPCGIGVVLVREGQKLYDAYHARGTYMQDVAGDTERSPCDYSAELTRPFRALRFWLPFKVHGSRAFSAALEEKLLLAQHFYKECGKIAGMRLGPWPDLSIVTFRLCPDGTDANAATRALLAAIQRDGRVFLTSTTVEGRFTIRMAILTYHTHIEDVDLALQVIDECAALIRGSKNIQGMLPGEAN
ncbi:MAG: aminotransferase class V-fold PLP-dependent enzyme [Gammaproteobacteria bacterium]|nr:aminotransferase class V-fold PLP-dependent enzyme [Gammaproteobacteria bacterium]